MALEKRISKLVDSGDIIVPLSAIHVMKVSAILKAHQRRAIVDIIRGVSRGSVLTPIDAMGYIQWQSQTYKTLAL